MSTYGVLSAYGMTTYVAPDSIIIIFRNMPVPGGNSSKECKNLDGNMARLGVSVSHCPARPIMSSEALNRAQRSH